jgi:acyl carrier protein
MTKNDFYREMEGLMQIEPHILNENSILTEVSDWDSLMVLSFIMMVEQKLGYVVDGRTVGKANSVKDLVDLLGNRLEE